jgi:steroid delta-isomerase
LEVLIEGDDMATREEMDAAVLEYCRAETEKDKDAWLALFTDDATHEDPVGARMNAGIDKLGLFWDSFQSFDVELYVTEPVIVCGNEAIAIMRCKTGPVENRVESGTIVDQFIFDDHGKIKALRAFHRGGE